MKGNRKKSVRKSLTVFITLLVILIGLCAAIVVVNSWRIDLKINGKQKIETEYGEAYHDKGAQAAFHGTLIPLDRELTVQVQNDVNTNKIGTYTVRYTASFHHLKKSAVRTVSVVDKEAPVIHLKENKDSYTLPGHAYEEEGYTATDNYDGDLTDKVTREEKDGVVRYTVTDSSGNVGTAERKIRYDDRTAPVITLVGGDSVSVLQGVEWNDLYSAADDSEGDVTAKVKIDGSVDINTPGTYTLTYSVTDQYGNTGTAKRTVTVQAVTAPKVIYLTFDDGPGEYTDQLLNILAKYNAKATFFVTGQNTKYLNCIAREAREGHAIGVHTYSHDYAKVYASTDAFWADCDKVQEIIKAQTGSRSDLLRFPGGSSNTISRHYTEGIMTTLTGQAAGKGYQYFDWNAYDGDAGETKDSNQVIANIKKQIAGEKISVVLCHDIHPWTVNAMDTFLQWATQQGYSFQALNAFSFAAHQHVNN